MSNQTRLICNSNSISPLAGVVHVEIVWRESTSGRALAFGSAFTKLHVAEMILVPRWHGNSLS